MSEKLNIQLSPLAINDLVLWDKWKSLVDFSIYQTHLFPEGFDPNRIEDYHISIIQANLEPIGSIWLEGIKSRESAWLGLFIGDPFYWNKGIGTIAIKMLIQDVFSKLALKSVYLKVRGENQRAIRCYEKVGFIKCRYHEPQRFADGSLQGWFEMGITNADRGTCPPIP